MPGRSTLTATTSPVSASLALWTCAIEAAATGSENSENNLVRRGTPSSDSIAALASATEKGGRRSCRTRNCVAISEPTTSGRVLKNLTEFDIGRPQSRQRTHHWRHIRVALDANPAKRPNQSARQNAQRLRRPQRLRAPRPSRPCVRALRRFGSDTARYCEVRALRVSNPNAAPRCPWSGCGISRSQTRPCAAWQGRCPDREFTDALDKVLIAVAVICDRLPHARNDVEGIQVVGLLHHVIRAIWLNSSTIRRPPGFNTR